LFAAGFCNRGGIRRVKFVACIASKSITICWPMVRVLLSAYQERILNSEGSAEFRVVEPRTTGSPDHKGASGEGL
jgi:hypothetical protein